MAALGIFGLQIHETGTEKRAGRKIRLLGLGTINQATWSAPTIRVVEGTVLEMCGLKTSPSGNWSGRV